MTARHIQSITAYTATGNTLSVASGRISYTFGLQGPALTVDTACSSSLVSMHAAFNSLSLHQCAGALNAGANLMLVVDTPAAFAKSGMLSADGRCKTLDSTADGYVRAEAAGAYLLRLLPKSSTPTPVTAAFAVLLSTAVNQDGRSSSLTAPNGPAQQEVIKSALISANSSPSAIAAIELHGTGTGLGDPIEMGALSAVMEVRSEGAVPLAVMAGKSLMGHSEPAAGVMGIAHAQLALNYAACLPLLHLHAANPYVRQVINSKVWMLSRQLGGLNAPRTDRHAIAGVSSFAFQGTNSHALLAALPGIFTSQAPAATTWQRCRHWVHPAVHALVCAASVQGDVANFEAHFGIPRLSELMNAISHKGKPFLTLAIVAELAGAVSTQLAISETKRLNLGNVVMQHLQIQPRLVLGCSVAPIRGSVEFQASDKERIAHVGTCQILAVPENFLADMNDITLSTCAYLLPDVSLDGCQLGELPVWMHGAEVVCTGAWEAAFTRFDGSLATGLTAMHSPTNTRQAKHFSIGLKGSSAVLCGEASGHATALGVHYAESHARTNMFTSAHTATTSNISSGIVYELSWAASTPALGCDRFTAVCTFSSKQNDPGTILGTLQSAVSVAETMAATASPTPTPTNGITRANFFTGAPILHGMLKAISQEMPSMTIAMGWSDENRGQWKLGLDGNELKHDTYGSAAAANVHFAPRLLPAGVPLSVSRQPTMGLQLITGGSGFLAGQLATYLIGCGTSGIVLSSRSGALPNDMRVSSSWQLLRTIKADSAFYSELEELQRTAVAAIYHASGMLADATVTRQELGGLRQVSRQCRQIGHLS